MQNDKLITVQEYARIKSCTTAAVYKQLKTGLQKYVVQLKTVDNAENTKKGQIKLNFTAMQQDGLIQVDNRESTVDNRESITIDYINTLKMQLAQKDAEINALQEQNTQLTLTLSRLADQSQQLQGHAQILLQENTEKPKKGFFYRLFNMTPDEKYMSDNLKQTDPERNTQK